MSPVGIDEQTRVIAFKRSYTFSAVLMCFFCISGLVGNIGSGLLDIRIFVVFLLAPIAAAFPMVKRGGLVGNLRTAIRISAVFTLATGTLIGMAFADFVQTGGGEGPRGEGSPLANIIAIAFGALLTVIPWLITTLRGAAHWRTS